MYVVVWWKGSKLDVQVALTHGLTAKGFQITEWSSHESQLSSNIFNIEITAQIYNIIIISHISQWNIKNKLVHK